ncbi:MAG TPA: discoidin domain-containing protein [Nitrososphaeraceae archaeon]|nr:discoidin domain-containing protein [Nitrososphaeraceae archaeon]
MFNNKELIGFLTHRWRSILIVIAVFGTLSQLAAYADSAVATSNDNDRKLDIRCETGHDDVCLVAACMGHPCVWYQNGSGSIVRNIDVAITKYNPLGLDAYEDSNIMQVVDGCLESTSNIQLIRTSGMDYASDAFKNYDENEDDNDNISILTKLTDNDYDTKWEEQGFGSFVQADLGSVQPVCNIGIAWDKGDERLYNFVISTSDDGTTFTDVLRGTSSGSTEALETYDLADVDSRFVRVTVFGNNDDNNDERDTAAINEIKIGTPTTVAGAQSNSNLSYGLSELFENNNASSSTDLTEITPDNYISELTDLISTDSFEDRIQKHDMDTNLPPSVEDLGIRAASVYSLEIELKGSDINNPDGLDYSIVDLPTHGVLKHGTDQDHILYYPNAGYIGSDSFSYRAIDDQGLESALGTVDIDIEDS